jgi:hypothetical protein
VDLTPTLLLLLHDFHSAFTQPTFRTFVDLVTGWILSGRRRFITECIFSAGRIGQGHWGRYHRFFSHAAWSLDTLCMLLARSLVARFVPTGPILLGGDDTWCRKRGLTLFGAGMHHDPLMSSKALKVFSWGHDWVVLFLLLPAPKWAPSKVFALPVGCRLYKNRQGLAKGRPKDKATRRPADPNHRTRPQLLVELLALFAAWFPDRPVVVSADSAYGGQSVLQKLPPRVDLISHVHPKGVLYTLPPPPTGRQGAPRKKGRRLPGLEAWADDPNQPWQELKFDPFGLHTTLRIKTQQALYYTAGKGRLLTIVLTRDAEGQRPDQRFYCTRLDWHARTILSTYACRWGVEVAFENGKQLLGLADAANRLPRAVERTAPMALVLYSLIVAWFDQEGHRQVRFPEKPWYRHKHEPSFADMLTTLRRQTWRENLTHLRPPDGVAEKQLEQLLEMACRAG